MTAWGRRFFSSITHILANNDEGPHLKLFRIEYAREYNHMIKNGFCITEQDAEKLLKSMV